MLKQIAAEPRYNEPLYNEPLYNELLYNELLYNEPLYNEPLYNELLYNEPFYNEPLNNEPRYNEPRYNELLYNDPLYCPKLHAILQVKVKVHGVSRELPLPLNCYALNCPFFHPGNYRTQNCMQYILPPAAFLSTILENYSRFKILLHSLTITSRLTVFQSHKTFERRFYDG